MTQIVPLVIRPRNSAERDLFRRPGRARRCPDSAGPVPTGRLSTRSAAAVGELGAERFTPLVRWASRRRGPRLRRRPARGRDHDAAAHAQVDAEVGTRRGRAADPGGLAPHRLAAPVRRGERAAGERVPQLAYRECEQQRTCPCRRPRRCAGAGPRRRSGWRAVSTSGSSGTHPFYPPGGEPRSRSGESPACRAASWQAGAPSGRRPPGGRCRRRYPG